MHNTTLTAKLSGSLALSLTLLLGSARAQNTDWRTVQPSPAALTTPVRLGLPQAMETSPALPSPPSARDARISPATYTVPATLSPPVPRSQSADGWVAAAPVLGEPQPLPPPTPAQYSTSHAAPPPPPPPPGGVDIYGVPPPPGNPIPPTGGPHAGPGLFGQEWLGCTTGCGRKMFESDHCFDNFISPVTNPFLFEDPRSLTEVRPIFMYQHAPSSNPIYSGGNLWFLGLQGRLAITERFSLVINKLGLVWNDPNNAAGPFATHFGFSELWLGPKLTFWRDDRTGTLAAFGVTLQIPTGGSDVFQSTGTLSVTPYLSFAQHFCRDFNFMTTLGFNISDNGRTDYFYSSYHLDYDLGGLHKFYPLVELNWFHYYKNGGTIPLDFEGRDLINFGSSQISGKDSLTLALGMRYKFNEVAQVGVGLEFPLIRTTDLLDFRLTVDFILRY
jgi:Putative MetA-pathway of phenol degradation